MSYTYVINILSCERKNIYTNINNIDMCLNKGKINTMKINKCKRKYIYIYTYTYTYTYTKNKYKRIHNLSPVGCWDLLSPFRAIASVAYPEHA